MPKRTVRQDSPGDNGSCTNWDTTAGEGATLCREEREPDPSFKSVCAATNGRWSAERCNPIFYDHLCIQDGSKQIGGGELRPVRLYYYLDANSDTIKVSDSQPAGPDDQPLNQ